MFKDQTVGVLGGGQLGRMLCEAASPLGVQVAILDAAGCPAQQISGNLCNEVGSFKDPAKIRQLARAVNVLTVEIEHVDVDVLDEIATHGVEIEETNEDGIKQTRTKCVQIHPAPRTLRLIQDKFKQKEHLQQQGLPVSKQVTIECSDDCIIESLRKAGEELGYPYMLKARKGSYDGRGNFAVLCSADVQQAAWELAGMSLYAEKWVNFKTELAVMVMRREDETVADTLAFPCVETVHEDSICGRTYMPPRGISHEIQERAKAIATRVVDTLWGRGVFAVEMFLLEDDSILVNEIAPRPHNSGHYTIEAVPQMSQFKAQLYAILNIAPPGIDPILSPRVRSAIMLNILGGTSPSSHLETVHLAKATFDSDMDVHVHLYGKESKPGRKIGHITFTSTELGINDLEHKVSPFIKATNFIAKERREAGTTSLRPNNSNNDAQEVLTKDKNETNSLEGTTAACESNGNGGHNSPLVAVTMGSDSDLKVMSDGLAILEKFQVPYQCTITSAHRTPALMMKFAKDAAQRGIKVIIAAAGGAAHLPGMLSSETTLPVIGVPVKATHLDGLDSLYSIVQMPRGVPTATVGINNSTNAALLAIRILGSFMPEYQQKLEHYQKSRASIVEGQAEKLATLGYKEYLAGMPFSSS